MAPSSVPWVRSCSAISSVSFMLSTFMLTQCQAIWTQTLTWMSTTFNWKIFRVHQSDPFLFSILQLSMVTMQHPTLLSAALLLHPQLAHEITVACASIWCLPSMKCMRTSEKPCDIRLKNKVPGFPWLPMCQWGSFHFWCPFKGGEWPAIKKISSCLVLHHF